MPAWCRKAIITNMEITNTEIRKEIESLIGAIKAHDSLEEVHIKETIRWIRSGVEIFRIQKPDIPNQHLISYFCLCDWEREKILLVEHKNAGLWLPSGGHVELGEHPKSTVERECLEELGIRAKFWREEPVFITSTVTVGHTAGHTDVSLWYVVEGDSSTPIEFDTEEFHSVRWFGFDEIPFGKSDPHMRRFMDKVKTLL